MYGLLGLAIFVELLGGVLGGQSVLAGGLTMALLALPIVTIAAAEAIRAVPGSLREGGYGLGATRWQVTRQLVLPAAAPGILRAATPGEREEGIAFWVETAAGDRLGYGPLASYAPGVGEGTAVAAGQPLGIDAGLLRLAWTRAGERVDPFPLLQATRPPAS